MRSVKCRVRSGILLLCAALILVVAGYAAGAKVESPDGLKCSISSADGGFKVSNLDAGYGELKASGLGIDRPIVFEMGREGRHLRRVYPSISKGALTFDAMPMAEYVVYPTSDYADSVLKSVCGIDPAGLSNSKKLDALASTADENGKADRHSRRLATEALQALLGIEFSAKMEYASTDGGDYRVYAGGDFRVTSSLSNRGTERLSGVSFGLMAPDEWTVQPSPQGASPTLAPGASTSKVCSVRAPERSSLRAPVSPVIAMVTFNYSGRRFTIHYPFEVKLADPFVPTLSIKRAHSDRIEAEIDLKSSYPGREMKGISVYPWLSTDLTIGPGNLSAGMSRGKGSFRLEYLPEPSTASYRAVTVIMKLDEHLVRLRSVMEASLDLGVTTRGAALWLNSYADGTTTAETIGERRCRKTASGSKYMYFAASPNVPTAGDTYITVTYYDDAQGSFRLQYDSAGQDGVYKDSADVVKLEGTRTWKRKTFMVSDAAFSDRQNAKSDFRLVALDGNLAIAGVVVSKFAPAETK